MGAAYLDGATARLVLYVLLGSDLRLGLLFEIQFHCLYLLVASARFVGRVFQGPDLGLGIPRQLHLLDLKQAGSV